MTSNARIDEHDFTEHVAASREANHTAQRAQQPPKPKCSAQASQIAPKTTIKGREARTTS